MELAARVLASGESLLAEMGGVPPWVAGVNAPTHEAVRAGLDADALAAAFEEGRSLTSEESVGLAREALGGR
jgi:hypothetical protein